MQLDAIEHFTDIVCTAIADYEQSETDLTHAVGAATAEDIRVAERRALRLGGAAAIYLHHFADIVAHRPPPWIFDAPRDLSVVQKLLEDSGADDLKLLGDVADALKHAVLTRRLPREVQEAGQVLVVDRACGEARFGESKYGGSPEVWVLAQSGKRPLSAVLQSVRLVWEELLGLNKGR